MRNELKKIYDEGKDLFGYPQEYKGLKLYPIKIKDLKYQHLFYKIFANPKTYIPNKDVLKSSYLKFLIYVVQESRNPGQSDYLDDLVDIMKYITKEDMMIQYKMLSGEGLASISLKFSFGDKEFIEEEFDKIREIVLEQNGTSIEYVEEFNPGLEESLNFHNRGQEDITFQDQLFTYCVLTKSSMKDIEDYTLFQFKNLWEKALTLKEYDIYKPLLVSGQIELKTGELKNFLYHSTKGGRYDSIKINTDAFLKSMGLNDDGFLEKEMKKEV